MHQERREDGRIARQGHGRGPLCHLAVSCSITCLAKYLLQLSAVLAADILVRRKIARTATTYRVYKYFPAPFRLRTEILTTRESFCKAEAPRRNETVDCCQSAWCSCTRKSQTRNTNVRIAEQINIREQLRVFGQANLKSNFSRDVTFVGKHENPVEKCDGRKVARS